MLQIKLFGPGQATYFGQPIPNFPSQQPHQLLCYLVLHARYPILRDQLAAVFWGEHPTSTSRKYLRNTLWKLRQAFEGVGADLDTYMLVNDESVAIRRASPYWLDVEIFESAAAQCQGIPGKDLSQDQATLLAEAARIYSGDLLEGNYCEWCLYERERLSLLYLSSLTKLASFNELRGNWERGLSYARNILARDNTREKAHLQMMRLYWMAGDRDSALAQYRRCAQVLGDELGIAPTRETALVYHQMAHNQYTPEILPAEAGPATTRTTTRANKMALGAAQGAAQEAVQEAAQGAAQGSTAKRVQKAIPNEGNPESLAERTLQRVLYLQAMLEETRSELRQIETLIQQELLQSERQNQGLAG